jgi:hypothetical protein
MRIEKGKKLQKEGQLKVDTEMRIEKGKRQQEEGQPTCRHTDEERWRKERFTSLQNKQRKKGREMNADSKRKDKQ